MEGMSEDFLKWYNLPTKTYSVYKKRDGKSFELDGYIYSKTFDEAKKYFAEKMTDHKYWEKSNIQWHYKRDGIVETTGWYEVNIPKDEEGKPMWDRVSPAKLLVSEADRDEGFSRWDEREYTWELRDSFTVIVC